ncbi:MAG: LON peptidase substrate-binding domain-containing protein [Polyangiaceae bacterium]
MSTIPVLGAMGAVLFPGMRCGILLATPQAKAAVRAVIEGPRPKQIAVFATRTPEPRDRDDLYSVGTFAQVVSLTRRRCCGRWVANLRGAGRARSIEYVQWEPFRTAEVEPLAESTGQSLVVEALGSAIRRAVTQLHERKPGCRHASGAWSALKAPIAACELAGAAAGLLRHLPVEEHQRLLEAEPLATQLEGVLAHLHGLLAQAEGEIRSPEGRAAALGWS